MTQYLGMPCPQCRRNLRVRVEYRGRHICCTYCGHPFLFAPEDDSLSAPRTENRAEPKVETDELASVLRQVPELRDQLAELRGEIRDLHQQLDQVQRSPAPTFVGQPEADADAPRDESARIDRLERELQEARAGLDRLQAELAGRRDAPETALSRQIDLAQVSDDELLQELRRDHREVFRNGHGANWPGAPTEEGDRSAFLIPTFGADLSLRFGDFELLEEVSRDGLTAVYMARRDGESEPINLQIEAKILAEPSNPEGPRPLAIPGFEILGKLCDGSMGVLYKARQSSVDRIVVIKVLRETLAQKPEFVERFRREARMVSRLAHRNIVATFDAGVSGGRHYLVMEHLEGETVQSRLDKGRLFDERPALQIALALAEALKHIHERGVVHRDLKPANVVLTREGNVKLIDLGLARLVDDSAWGATEEGMAIGTPEYLSPEQARGQVDVDVRGDIYGLGATLYHMVTGYVPHAGSTAPEILRKHVDIKTPLLPPESINRKLTAGFAAVIKKMMARKREDRYRNPDDLILDLKSLLQGLRPALAQPIIPGETRVRPEVDPRRVAGVETLNRDAI